MQNAGNRGNGYVGTLRRRRPVPIRRLLVCVLLLAVGACTGGETVAHDPAPRSTSPSVATGPTTGEDQTPADENSPATDPLAEVCADPEQWYQWGVSAADIAFAHAEISGRPTVRLDQTDVAMFERHSRDARAMAAEAPDAKLSRAYETSARMYAAAAGAGRLSLHGGMNLTHADRVVADRCDLLLAGSDLGSGE